MRLADINNQKRDAILILCEELVEGGNLPPERRSGVTAEDQHHRLHFIQRRELNESAFVLFG
jgi:hypothetical protein